jgi:hypothetical protein
VRAISKSYPFRWGEIFQAAKEKDAGVDAKNAVEILLGFPEQLFADTENDRISKWEQAPK